MVPLPRALLGLLLSVFAAQAAAASVYRWVDRNGVVHYDDVSSGGQRVTRDLLKQRDIPEEPEWAGTVPAALVAEVRQRCAHARERLASYRGAPVVYGRDPSGNVYRLSPTQLRLMLGELDGETRRYCGDDAPRRIHDERLAEARAAQAERMPRRR